MRSKKNPRLYVLPLKDAFIPSWEEKKHVPDMNEQAIKRQMDKLHSISSAVFVATILLEICLWQLVEAMDEVLSVAGFAAVIAAMLAAGLIGGVLSYLTASVEASVRQSLSASKTEDCEYV